MNTRAGNRAAQTSRPYVGDEMRRPQGPVGTASVSLSFVLLSIAVGFVIGFAVYLLMNLSTWLTQRLWSLSGSFALFPLVVCTIGGVAIGIWTWWSHDEIKPLKEVMGTFKSTGSYRTNGVWKPTVTFLLPLVFGGSIGFEAGLTGLITSGCCWIRDQIKKAGLRVADITDVTVAASIAAIFRTPLAGIAVGAENEPDVDNYEMRRGAKIVLYIAAAFGAFAGIRVFSSLFSVSGGLPRFEEISSSPKDMLWVIPCLALAYVMTLVFHASNTLFAMIGSRMKQHAAGVIARPIICGVAIGAIACFLPYVLFPGETQAEELMETWTSWTAVALLATGVIKAAATPFCIHMGWVGGDLFPSIFAGVAAGYGMAALTGADPMLMVTVTTAAFLAGVLRKPLIALGILFLCFPADGILWLGIACVIGATLPVPAMLLGEKE